MAAVKKWWEVSGIWLILIVTILVSFYTVIRFVGPMPAATSDRFLYFLVVLVWGVLTSLVAVIIEFAMALDLDDGYGGMRVGDRALALYFLVWGIGVVWLVTMLFSPSDLNYWRGFFAISIIAILEVVVFVVFIRLAEKPDPELEIG